MTVERRYQKLIWTLTSRNVAGEHHFVDVTKGAGAVEPADGMRLCYATINQHTHTHAYAFLLYASALLNYQSNQTNNQARSQRTKFFLLPLLLQYCFFAIKRNAAQLKVEEAKRQMRKAKFDSERCAFECLLVLWRPLSINGFLLLLPPVPQREVGTHTYSTFGVQHYAWMLSICEGSRLELR